MSGGWNCEPLTVVLSTADRTGSGKSRKKSRLARSAASGGSCSTIPMALWRGLLLSFAGQTWTQERATRAILERHLERVELARVFRRAERRRREASVGARVEPAGS